MSLCARPARAHAIRLRALEAGAARRIVASALVTVAIAGCSVVPDYGEATAEPTATAVATARTPAPAAVQPVAYAVVPLEVGRGAPSIVKTLLFFRNRNTFLVDWSMVVRVPARDGGAPREERIGTTGLPVDRSDPAFENWYFPIPPGDSWAVVRFETTFAQANVESFQVVPSVTTLADLSAVELGPYDCADVGGVVGCTLQLSSTEDLPRYTRLHLVVLVLGGDAAAQPLRAMQWRPEVVAAPTPWLSLRAGEKLDLQFADGYPTPPAPWRVQVQLHAYQFGAP